MKTKNSKLDAIKDIKKILPKNMKKEKIKSIEDIINKIYANDNKGEKIKTTSKSNINVYRCPGNVCI